MENPIRVLNQKYHYLPIAYHDSWISIDPIIGCSLNCQYCFMRLIQWTGIKPKLIHPIPGIVEMLLSHKYFTPHRTVLSFGNQTDSFLPENIHHTLEFLKLLEAYRLINPVAFVTKKLIPRDFLEEVKKLEYVRPIFCLSYSGLPEYIEKGNKPEDNQENFKNLAGLGLRVIHFWRPLFEINGTNDALERILDFVVQYSSASVYIGLKLNPSLYSIYMTNPHMQLPGKFASFYGDYIPGGVEERLRSLVLSKYPGYPLYKHTSCAVSLVLAQPDYNATLYRPLICIGSECPNRQRLICENNRIIPDREKVAFILRKMGLKYDFRVNEGIVKIFGDLEQEEYNYLLHQLNYPLAVNNLHFNRILRGSIFRKNNTTVME